MSMVDEKVMYTVEEVAKMVRVSEQTIRRMIARGEIEVQRVGRQVRIPKREVDRLVGDGQQ